MTLRVLLIVLVLGGGSLKLNAQENESPEPATAFEQRIKELGLDEITNDYSASKKIIIDEPTCAYINITGTDVMPVNKSQSMNVWMDVYLGDGGYFRKRAVIGAQGNSSMAFEKKNFKADFCEDEWVGDETTSLTIGDWVKMDGFHFKAYYIDWLRGIAVVGYKLYDEMVQDVGRPWTRATEHLSKPKDNARCYPDGFPCIVYLNGDYYGIFSWQLKKHRDNMNQAKNIAGHIHLDGNMGDAELWHGTSVQWNQFEVRNPKGLYTMDGSKYDGDNPAELMDETSAYYNLDSDDEKTTEDKQRTAQVKQSILTLSRLYAQMEQMVADHATDDELRAFFEEHFDLTSLVDYACLHYVVNNFDGFTKNWQWFTYDGQKWFVAPYDLDCTFGNFYTGGLTMPAEWNSVGEHYSTFRKYGPFYWMNKLYQKEIKERYIALRMAGVIDAKHIQELINDWYQRVETNYADEWQRWPNSMCITETVANDGWQLVGVDGYWNYSQYDKSVTYQSGDRCQMSHHVWEATCTVTGVTPYVKLGYVDSLERYLSWITRRIELQDDNFGYVPEITTALASIVNQDSKGAYDIYDVSGRRLSVLQSGMNIIRYHSGKAQKVFLP